MIKLSPPLQEKLDKFKTWDARTGSIGKLHNRLALAFEEKLDKFVDWYDHTGWLEKLRKGVAYLVVILGCLAGLWGFFSVVSLMQLLTALVVAASCFALVMLVFWSFNTVFTSKE